MDKMWTWYSSVILLSVIQIQHALASDCDIVSVTSPAASTLNVVWSNYTGASVYLLNLRVVNSTTIPPVVVMQPAPSTQKLIQGLRPGNVYEVTLKVFQFYTVVCTAVEIAITVPATSQITFSKAISSTSIRFEWSSVIGADSYILFVEKLFSSLPQTYNQTFTTLGGQMDSLTPSTTYNCYVYSSNTAGRGAKSNTKTIITLVQPPTGVTLVLTGTNTVQVTWQPVSKVLLYQVTVSNNKKPSNATVIKVTPRTTMNISNLEPCSTYTVGVSSVNVFLVPGEASNVSYTTSTINPVTTISSDYSCSSNMVTVTWDLVFGTNLYRATAVDSTGASLNCTSASTSCQITKLKCGENYQVQVTAILDNCESTSSTSSLFETVPCAPADPTTLHDCASNVIVFSWQPTNNTFYYVATAVDITGVSTKCMTEDNSCYFTNTDCGQLYTYTVYAVSSECNSEVSQPEFVRTSPCLPTNIKTADECHSDMLITTWDSAAGALSYTVEARGNTKETYSCTSSSNSCEVTGVPCGEQLSVWIVASNDNCSTEQVLGDVAQTIPCTPSNVSVSVDCSQDSATVHWETSIGAIFYIVVAEDENGNSHRCHSMDTNCLIEGLKCGQNYTGSIVATNLMCNSTTSEKVTFKTAPCPPTNIKAFIDCDGNNALIVWQNHQPTGLYTATIVDQSGAQLTCASNTVNNCKITSLPCGKRYSITVTYNDGICSSTSTAINMDSVPCSPEDVRASVACATGKLTVTWNISVPTDNYTTSISRGIGQPLRCNSTETQCTMGGLLCGSSYVVVVFSITGTCFSQPSTEVTVQTLPCPPTNISAMHTCAPDPVLVSWVASDNAKYYTAVAVSRRGHRSQCTTNKTACSLPGLHCGEIYTVGVRGADDNCTGQLTDTVSLNTEPCSPSNVSSQLICNTGTAQVSWAATANAVNYTVKANSNEHIVTCSSPSPNCTLSNLVCGQAYEIFVTATDGTCVSKFSAPFRQDQAPCAPQNVSTNLSCDTNDLTVSWTLSALPLNYSVTAVPLGGNISSVTCHTRDANCSLTGLQCGQTYNVSAKATSDKCSGPCSPAQTVQTAPCSPQSLTAVTGTNSLLASWNASHGATSYTTTVTGPNGFSVTSSSSSLTWSVSGLQCANQYKVTVTSQDSHCTSSPTQTVMRTESCDPVNVTSVLQCGSDTATVSWMADARAVAYTVHAQGNSSQQYTSCRTNTTSCQLKQLQCGKVYNLTVMAEDATLNSTGLLSTSLTTAPCPPSFQNSTLICGTNSSSLSWMQMAHATGYVVNATATNGHNVSCSSDTATCTLTDLQCSKTYMTTITAQGSQCESAPGSSINITTAPCSPAIIPKQYMCSNKTAVFSWTDPVGRLSFLAQVAGEGYEDSCKTTNTSCAFQNLPCGLNFNLTVQAQGMQCNSIPSVSESFETAPCAPENVSSTLVCFNHSALVSWVGSPTAVGYNVTATGQDGHTHHCQTNTTSCQLPFLHCDETYGITVTPYSKMCRGSPSAVYSFRAGRCALSNVTVSPACQGSIVSWSHATGAEMFIATATADDGHTHTCISNYSNSCNFTDLHCGETYAITVVTVDRGCMSNRSSAVQLKTALCLPTNLTGQVSCDTNTLTLMWDKSPVSGATYTLQTERIGGTHPPSVHTTSNTLHMLTNLQCGQRYAFRISAHDGNCSSSYSPPTEISTAPCQPTNLTARVDCGTNNGNFSWAQASGAGFYTVEVTGEHGHVASCSSNGTSCAVKLHCGLPYTATLVASVESCNSSKHADINFDSAPCLPKDVLAEIQCNTNVMNVSWTRTSGSQEYTAWAISTDGHRSFCNSTSNCCSIHGLQCGKVYEVAVTSSSIDCKVIAGSDYKVQSAPCKPENTTVDQNCSSNLMTVKWNQSSMTQNYTVKATSASGVNSTCDSNESSCSFLNLSCGQLYTFTVMGYTNACMSEMSTPMKDLTAPCPPTNVSAKLNCTTHKALISWINTDADAATAYSVQATSINGHHSSCSQMGTSCDLNNLVCGQEYSVTVEAMYAGCSGPVSAPARLATEPCVPMNLSVHYNVGTAKVMWQAASGASSYSVQAVTDQGLTVNCNTTNTSCFLNGLECSQTYNVTVMARNLACDSVVSKTHHLLTEPCPPTNVQASMACEQLTSTVSWQQTNLAVGYVAYFNNQHDHNTSCVGLSTDTFCVVSGLMCGTVYNVWVKALGWRYNSSDSTVISITSGPCQTGSIKAIMDCEAHSATISWLPSVGAMYYVSDLRASSGHNTSCTTNQTRCELRSLQCGEDYNVTVMALGVTCNSTAQMGVYLTTEPCVPMNLSVHYNVSTAQVIWTAARDASFYAVQAVTDQGLTVSCNTTNTSCILNGLQCSQIYNVTVIPQNLACNNTVTSKPYRLMTEPCPPTNIQASMACKQLSSTVSWQQSYLAVGYVAYFNNQNGHNTSCIGSSTDTFCVVPGLMCGTVYNVWVKALGGWYNSSDSTVISLSSGPCQTGSIKAIMDCEAHSATISWLPSVGAMYYVTDLRASSSHNTSCTTNQTRCELRSLQCGEDYNVTVMALGVTCNSTAQMGVYLTTEPCVPMNLSVHYNVSTAQVIWTAARDASFYAVQAVTDQGLTVSCNTTNTSCILNGLQCSQIYNVTVIPQNLACNNTVTSKPYRLMTEPCPPTNIQASIACKQLSSTVSWQQSYLAVGYVAYFNNQNGHNTSCIGSSTDTFCVVPGLMCGTVYNVWVKALGGWYNSSDSTVVSLTSAPCLPKEVEIRFHCDSDGPAVVSWNTTYGTANLSLTTIISGSLQTLCATQENSCNVTGLRCGDTYSLSLNASNKQCSLTAPVRTNLTTRPCPPQRVAVDLQCGSRAAVLFWDKRSDVELYIARAIKTSGGGMQKCNSTGSTCQFPGLDCGETYNFTVTAHSQGCYSQDSITVFIQTEPCPPVNVSAQAFCQSKEVEISWHQASSVVNYLVTATGRLGYVEIYNTTQTLLSAALPCGQQYNVTVQAQGSKCNSLPSSPAFFKTAPCIPRNVTTYVECEFNVGSVSWGPSDGAAAYVVVATGLDGHTHHCLTNTTSCTWNDLHCEEVYTVVVRAKDGNCTSLPSNSSVIHMDPCVPQNLVASVNCNMKVVSLSWDASNRTMLYMVSAKAGNKSVELNTNVTTTRFFDLTCGQNYSLTVTPHNQYCPGSSTAPAFIQTWPCQPAGVSTIQDCLSGISLVTWVASNGSDYYTATLQTNTGISKMCTSDSNKCSVPGLTCGHNFSVSVTACNQRCNVTSHQTSSLQSVPCVPTNVSLVMNCANNSAVVAWSASRGAVQYTVTAYSNLSNVSCQTSGLNCSLDKLICGSQYTVQVVAMDDKCSTIPSQALMLNSAPCLPQNVSVEVSCLSNDLTISWDAMREADHFLVSVIAENGGISKFSNTTNTACSISNVTCGNRFRVHVTSVRGTCRSEHSQNHSIQSAPCQPQVIRGKLDCVTNSAWISWDSASGVDSYSVSAVGGEDHTANCTTSSNTTCEVEDLACGVLYNFSVIAKNSKCESQPSATIDLQTAPCSLSSITAVPLCHNSSILVMWDQMQGSKGKTVYTVTAEARDHAYLSCNSTGTRCYLSGARCDSHYTIIVAASTNQCSSMRSPPYRISMEPCPPRNVVVNPSCEDRGVLVSWSPSPVAETYHVVIMSVARHVHTCNTTSSNCSVSELLCDQRYTVFVTASHDNCSSKASQNVTFNTGPCQPDGLSVTFSCTTQSALLSWTPRYNAADYYGCAQAGNGDMLYCHSTNQTCVIQGLECGAVYNFSVQASDGVCNSSFSDPVQKGAAPCPPDAVEVQLLPMAMETQVIRFNWTEITCSDDYLLRLTGRLLGDSQAQFKLCSYWTNVTYFEFPLPCGSSYVATVESRNAASNSSQSVPLSGTTAPCPPSGVVYRGNSSFATVSWNASVFATMYTVYDNSVTPKAQLCSTAGLSCSLSNVTSTNMVITASNAAGQSEEILITIVVTQGRRRRDLSEQMPKNGGLSAPVLDVTQTMPSVIFIEWSQVDAASHYSLVIRKQGSSSDPQELTVYGESIILTDLSPDSTYCFSVSASGGAESEPVCVRTGQGLPQ